MQRRHKRASLRRAPVLAGIAAASLIIGIGGASGISSAATSSAGVAQAKAFILKYEKTPTVVGNTTPLPKRPPKGKLFVNCIAPQPAETEVANGSAAAAKALGWQFKNIIFSLADPSTLVACMNQAIQFHAYAVAFAGLPEATWATEIPAAKAAGMIIIPNSAGALKYTTTVPGAINTPADAVLDGKLLGEYFIAKSNGKGKALLADVPDIGALANIGQGFRSVVSKECPGCSVDTISINLPDFDTNGGENDIVSAAQKDIQDTWIVSEQVLQVQGLPSGLAAAGITHDEIIGANPQNNTLAYVANGTAGPLSAMTDISDTMLGWMSVDIAARDSVGAKPTAGLVPLQILTKATLPNPLPTEIINPKNYVSQYEKLWKVSK